MHNIKHLRVKYRLSFTCSSDACNRFSGLFCFDSWSLSRPTHIQLE